MGMKLAIENPCTAELTKIPSQLTKDDRNAFACVHCLRTTDRASVSPALRQKGRFGLPQHRIDLKLLHEADLILSPGMGTDFIQLITTYRAPTMGQVLGSD